MRHGVRRSAQILAASAGLSAAGASISRAQTMASWASPVSGNWTDPTLWSTNPNFPANDLPNNGDAYIAIINQPGPTYTVTLADSITLSGLTLDSAAATLSHSAGTLNLVGNSTINAGTYQLSGGAIAGNGFMVVNSRLDWSSGTIGVNGGGTTSIAHGAILTLGPTADQRILGQQLDNSGTTNFTGGTLGMINATFRNLPDGVLNISSPNNFINVLGANTLSNQGTLNFGVSGSDTFIVSPKLVNAGTLACSAGTLLFNSPITNNGGAYITGPGFINFTNQQTLGDGVTTYAGTGIHFSGQLSGSGDLMIASGFTWVGGNIGGSGVMTIPAAVAVNCTGGRCELDRVLNNSGTINVLSGLFDVGYAAPGTLNNLAGSAINLSGSVSLGGGFAPSAINNSGVINVNAGTIGVTTFSTSGATQAFSNSATISVNSGTLVMSMNSSTFTHNAGSQIKGAGTMLLGGVSGRQVINGAVDWSVANVVMNGGTIINSGQLSIDGTFHMTGGILSGAGSYLVNGGLDWGAGTIGTAFAPPPGGNAYLEIASGGSLLMSTGPAGSSRGLIGTLNNAGIIEFNGGSLALSGTLHNLSGGLFNLDLGGNPMNGASGPQPPLLLNDGTVNVNGASLSFGVVLAVPFTNNGTVNVTTGTLSLYNPADVSSGTINGPVQNLLGLTLAGGRIDWLDGPAGSLTVSAGATASAGHVRQYSINLMDGATLKIRPGGGDDGTSRAGSFAFGTGSSIDLADNALIVNYNGPDPIVTVLQEVRDGKLTSSLADSHRRLAVADNAVLNLGSFGGQTFIDNTVLVKLTFIGDTNLDGAVDVTDLGKLATNWQSTGNWTEGDFNYDGFVDVTDLGALATNWQAGTSGGMSPDAAMASVGLGGVSIPEPLGSGAFVGLVTLAGILRRRRRGVVESKS